MLSDAVAINQRILTAQSVALLLIWLLPPGVV